FPAAQVPAVEELDRCSPDRFVPALESRSAAAGPGDATPLIVRGFATERLSFQPALKMQVVLAVLPLHRQCEANATRLELDARDRPRAPEPADEGAYQRGAT